MELKDIWGNEAAKRATEIAEAGKHSIKYIGNGEAELFRQYCQERGIQAYVLRPCPCGNYGDQRETCVCAPGEIQRWQRTIMDCPTDLTVKTFRVLFRATEHKLPCEVDKDARNLLEHAGIHMGLGQADTMSALNTAQTIARLGGYAQVKAPHLAEALQYRSVG